MLGYFRCEGEADPPESCHLALAVLDVLAAPLLVE